MGPKEFWKKLLFFNSSDKNNMQGIASRHVQIGGMDMESIRLKQI
jgi:hypothetical protein